MNTQRPGETRIDYANRLARQESEVIAARHKRIEDALLAADIDLYDFVEWMAARLADRTP